MFGWFGGPGLNTTGQFFEAIGFVPGRRHALMAGLAETGGGLLLALGLLTPFAAAVVFGVMLVAAFSVHVKKGFFITSGGYEYTLVLGVAALMLAFTGPGLLSMDAPPQIQRQRRVLGPGSIRRRCSRGNSPAHSAKSCTHCVNTRW